jgi:hypothetical protein
MAVVWLQCFSFSSRGEAMEQSRGSELILASWLHEKEA